MFRWRLSLQLAGFLSVLLNTCVDAQPIVTYGPACSNANMAVFVVLLGFLCEKTKVGNVGYTCLISLRSLSCHSTPPFRNITDNSLG